MSTAPPIIFVSCLHFPAGYAALQEIRPVAPVGHDRSYTALAVDPLYFLVRARCPAGILGNRES